MSVIDKIRSAFTAVGADIKALRAEVDALKAQGGGGGAASGIAISEHGIINPTVLSTNVQSVTFKKQYTKKPTVVATLYDNGQNRLLYGQAVTTTGFTCKSNYFTAAQELHYIVISND